MKTCALYIRVSTDEQTELSPDAQKRLLKEYAHKNNMLVLEEYIFLENGISGRKADKRPEFQKMIGLCKSKEHPIDVILVWKFSRFARNQEESIVYKSLLRRNNVDVISISEPLPDGMIGSLVERIFEWMDEYYSINLSTEVIRGMTENALRGGYQGSIPIGYKHTGYHDIPEVDEENAAIVRYIFKSYNKGATFTQIARNLNAKGYTTIRGSIWENRTVRYVLQNPFYIGKVRWNYYDRSTSSYKPSDEVIIADGKHEPIIDIETWDIAQERLSKHLQIHPKKRDVSTCKHWLSGTLVCSTCGKTLAHNNTSKYKGFQCYGYTKGQCTKSHFVLDTAAENAVIGGLNSILSNFGSISDYNIRIIKKENDASELESLKKSLSKLSTKESKIKAAYIDGIDTLEEYKENKLLLQSEREKITAAIEELSTTAVDENSFTDKQKFLDKLRQVLEVLENPISTDIEKGNAINSIVESIVFDRENFTFDFSFCFAE